MAKNGRQFVHVQVEELAQVGAVLAVPATLIEALELGGFVIQKQTIDGFRWSGEGCGDMLLKTLGAVVVRV